MEKTFACKAELKNSWIVHETNTRSNAYYVCSHYIKNLKTQINCLAQVYHNSMVHKIKNVLHAILLAYLAMKSYTCTDCIKNKVILAYTIEITTMKY